MAQHWGCEQGHDEEHQPGGEKTPMGLAAPAGIPEPGMHRRKGVEARGKKGLGLGSH